MPADDLLPGLRAWIRGHDPHVRAAVELLIAHNDAFWLRKPSFTHFVHASSSSVSSEVYIDFRAAAAALNADRLADASTTEIAVLRLACDLATDRYRLSHMSDTTVRMVRQAIATATQ